MTANYEHIPGSWIEAYLKDNKTFAEYIKAKARDVIEANPKPEGVVKVIKLKHCKEAYPKTYYALASDLCSVFAMLSEDTSSHDLSDTIRVMLDGSHSSDDSNPDDSEPDTYFVSKYALVRDYGNNDTLWGATDMSSPDITLHLIRQPQFQAKELVNDLGERILRQAIICDSIELFQLVTEARSCVDDILLGITIYNSIKVLKYLVQTYPDRAREMANPVLRGQCVPICMAAWKGHDAVAEIIFDLTDRKTILNAEKSLLVETMHGYGALEGMCLDRIVNKLASNMDLVTALANREPCHANTLLFEFAKMVEAAKHRPLSTIED